MYCYQIIMYYYVKGTDTLCNDQWLIAQQIETPLINKLM